VGAEKKAFIWEGREESESRKRTLHTLVHDGHDGTCGEIFDAIASYKFAYLSLTMTAGTSRDSPHAKSPQNTQNSSMRTEPRRS
jgi:hypothetical protein